jgi:hypothetical protein
MSTLGKLYIKEVVNFNQFSIEDETMLKFDMNSNLGVPLIKVTLDLDTLYFLVDAGAYSAVSNKVVQLLNGRLSSRIVSSSKDSHNERHIANHYFFSMLPLGGHQFYDIELSTMESILFPNFNIEIHGVLGIDFLKHFYTYFNHDKQEITFSNFQSAPLLRSTNLKLQKKWDQRYYFQLKSSELSADLVFDSGSNQTVIDKKKFANHFPIDCNRNLSVALNSAKMDNVNSYVLNNVNINKNLKLPQLKVSSDAYGNNLLGYDFFKGRNFLFDPFEQSLSIESFEQLVLNHKTSLSEQSNFEIKFFNNMFHISKVSCKFNELYGLEPTDVCEKINELFMRDLCDLGFVYDYLNKCNFQTPISLTVIRNGVLIDIIIPIDKINLFDSETVQFF